MDRATYLELIEPAISIAEKKGEDYNGGASVHDYFPFGDKSYVQMLHVKSQRLVQLTSDDRLNNKPNFESKRDTVLDLINY